MLDSFRTAIASIYDEQMLKNVIDNLGALPEALSRHSDEGVRSLEPGFVSTKTTSSTEPSCSSTWRLCSCRSSSEPDRGMDGLLETDPPAIIALDLDELLKAATDRHRPPRISDLPRQRWQYKQEAGALQRSSVTARAQELTLLGAFKSPGFWANMWGACKAGQAPASQLDRRYCLPTLIKGIHRNISQLDSITFGSEQLDNYNSVLNDTTRARRDGID